MNKTCLPIAWLMLGWLLAVLPCGVLRAQQEADGGPGIPGGPPAPPTLRDLEELGRNLFFDKTLSTPAGYSCASCHLPAAGFTGPSSTINLQAGPVPGVIEGRFGHRKPQAIAYSAFSPLGPVFSPDVQVWMGGNFWDGRALDNATQARMPFIDPNEMANQLTGPPPPHPGGFAAQITAQLPGRPYAALYRSVYGSSVFSGTSPADLFTQVVNAIAAYEAGAEVNPFSSKFDRSAWGLPEGTEPLPTQEPLYPLTASEERGRSLFFTTAQCFQCHSSATLKPVLNVTGGRNTFTMYCYANIGVPRNPNNPCYRQPESHAAGHSEGTSNVGEAFIDYGLGGNPNPAPALGTPTDGTPFMHRTPGDIAAFRGLFKAPTVRNADKRPSPSFVKAYMHNGVFKSLEEVVHFYNKRNIAVDRDQHEVVYDLRVGPPKGFTPLFPPPEVMDNVQNASGATPATAGKEVADNGQIGHLNLTPQQEADIVAFLKTLTDGYSTPTFVVGAN